MRKEDLYRLDRNREYICGEVDANDIVSYSFEIGLTTVWENQDIQSLTNGKSRTSKFLMVLEEKGNDAYQLFYKCMKEIYPHVAERLDSTDMTLAGVSPCSWFDDLDEKIKQRIISDADASRVARCVGRGWELLLLDLGLSQIDIELEKEKTRDSNLCICHLLIRWRQKKYPEATVQILVETMNQIGRKLTVDWEMLGECMKK